MSTKMLVLSAFGLVVLFSARPAHAYIDPGTGMTFLSGIGAFVMGFVALAFGAIAMTFRRWMTLIKTTFSSIFGGRHSS